MTELSFLECNEVVWERSW